MKPTEEHDTMEELSNTELNGDKATTHLPDYESLNGFMGMEMQTADALKVRAKGPGLLSGHVNQYEMFYLDARKAGCGDVDVVVKGPSKATITFVEEEEALYRVHYIVSLPGDYFIEIRFNENHVPGSPFPLYIGFDRSSSSSLIGSAPSLEDVSVDMTDYNSNDLAVASPPKPRHIKAKREKQLSALLEATVQSPSGITLKGELVRKVDKTFAVTFPHPEVGTYLVSIINTSTGKAIRGSPFKIHINELAEEEEMRVTGKALERCRLGEAGVIKFQARGTLHLADLILAFEGSGLGSLRAVQSDNTSVDFLFVPKKAGILSMHAYYKGSHLTGSPFEIRVTNRSAMMSRYEILPKSNSAGYSKIIIWIASTTSHPVQTNVLSPSGIKVEHTLLPFDEGSFELTYSASEYGSYKLEVSTFHSKGPITFPLTHGGVPQGDTLPDVHVEYPTESNVGEKCLLVLRSLIGPVHQLSVEIKGPGKIDVDQMMEKDRVLIYYQGTVPGIYKIDIFRNGASVNAAAWHFTLLEAN